MANATPSDVLAIAVSVVQLTQQVNDSGRLFKRKVEDAQELVRFAHECTLDEELGAIFDRALKEYKQAYSAAKVGHGFWSSMKVGSIDVFRFQRVRLFFTIEAGVTGNILTIIQEPYDRFCSIPPGSILRPANFTMPSPDAIMPSNQAPFKRLQVTAGGHGLTVEELHPDVAVQSHEDATSGADGDRANQAPQPRVDSQGYTIPSLPANRPIRPAKPRRPAQAAAASQDTVLVPDSQVQNPPTTAPKAAHALWLRTQAATDRQRSMPITHSSPAEDAAVRAKTVAPPQPPANLADRNGLPPSTNTRETLPTPDRSEERRRSHDQHAPTSAQQPRSLHAPLSEQARRFINPTSADDMALQDPIEDDENQYLNAMDDDFDYEYLPTEPVQHRGRTRSRSLESIPPVRNPGDVDERTSSNQLNRTQGNGGQTTIGFSRDKQKGAIGPSGPALAAQLDRQYRRAPSRPQPTSEQHTTTEAASRVSAAPSTATSTARNSHTNAESIPRSSNAFDELRSSQTAPSSSRRGGSTVKWSREEDIAVLRGMKWNITASKVIKLFKLDRTQSGLRNRKKTLLEKFAASGGKVPPGHEYYAEVEQSVDPSRRVASAVSSSPAIVQLDEDRADEVDGSGALVQEEESVNLFEQARKNSSNEVDGGGALVEEEGVREVDGEGALVEEEGPVEEEVPVEEEGLVEEECIDPLEEAHEGEMQRRASPQVVISPPGEDQDEVDELYAVSVDGNMEDQPGPASPTASRDSRASRRHQRRDNTRQKRRSETSRASSSLTNNLSSETGVTPSDPPDPEPEAMHAQESVEESSPNPELEAMHAQLNGDESSPNREPETMDEEEIGDESSPNPAPETMHAEVIGKEIPPSQYCPIVTEPYDLRTPLTEPDAKGMVNIGRPGYPVPMALGAIGTDKDMWDMAKRMSKQRLGLAKTQYEFEWLGYQAYIAMVGRDWDEHARLTKKLKPLESFLRAKQAGKVDVNATLADWVPDRPQHDGSVDEEFDREGAGGSGDEEYGSDYGEYYDAEEGCGGAVLPDFEEYPNGVERDREFEEVEDDEEEPSNTIPAATNGVATNGVTTNGAAANGVATNDPANPFGLTPSRLNYRIPPGPRRPPPPPRPAQLPYSDNDTESSSSSGESSSSDESSEEDSD